ncbi:MAG: peptidoglycan DD-metalloendopeptidase family protein [Flavobacteriaceae bacterium]
MKNLLLITLTILAISCKKEVKPIPVIEKKPVIVKKFGYVFNDYKVIESIVKKDETFGYLMDKHHVENPTINKIVANSKNTFDIARNLRVGKRYTILASKDSTEKAQVFIYQPNKVEYLVLDLNNKEKAYIGKKPVKTVIKTASGIIDSSLSNAIEAQGVNYNLTFALSDIYAWTIDFYHLSKGDKYKVIYEERFIDDSVSVGIGNIKAAYFEHKKKPFYGFRYVVDSTKNIPEFYDDQTNNLRRAFLKAPLKFSSRVSSRYNLKRRIKHYGNRVKAHRGTDFPSPIGTPIVSTANGTVTKSAYRGGNGNYVKIKHNGTYSTQYLHMKKRKVKVGDFVKQGDVIGWIGMTGSTAGPHVCYRFWKNGKEVDPFKQKLPSADPMKKDVVPLFKEFIIPIKSQLDSIQYPMEQIEIVLDTLETPIKS